MESYIYFIPALITLLVGLLLGGLLKKGTQKKIVEQAKSRADELLRKAQLEAEATKKEKMLQAKEHFIELKSKHDSAIHQREKRITEIETKGRLLQSVAHKEVKKNTDLQRKLEEQTSFLEKKQAKVLVKEQELEDKIKIQITKLEELSNLSAEDAKAEMMESLKEKAKADAMAFVQHSEEEAKLTAQQEAKKIVINTIQRIGTEEAVDNCVSIFNLESDDVKGRIIGREGRNIRTLEAETGVEIIVDDTPEAIILSCFDPVRREIARLSLHRLVSDGRIHPARIEEVVHKTRKQMKFSVEHQSI